VISDEELAQLALAADPHTPIAPDAVPLELAAPGADALPGWYMAPVRRHRLGRSGRLVTLGLVGSFLAIEAFGLCSTYGQLPFH